METHTHTHTKLEAQLSSTLLGITTLFSHRQAIMSALHQGKSLIVVALRQRLTQPVTIFYRKPGEKRDALLMISRHPAVF